MEDLQRLALLALRTVAAEEEAQHHALLVSPMPGRRLPNYSEHGHN